MNQFQVHHHFRPSSTLNRTSFRVIRSMFWGLEKLSYVWNSMDGKILRNPGALDRTLDRAVARLRGGFVPVSFYEQGWGDIEVPSTFYAWMERWSREMEVAKKHRADPLLLPRRIDVTFNGPAIRLKHRNTPINVREFEFPSPAREILHLLPRESHMAKACLVSCSSLHADENPETWGNRIVILLAGTGEHGFSRRAASLALPLAQQHGITSVILESPFYGYRKPREQIASKLRHVSDLPTLGRATIEETLSLIRFINVHNDKVSLAVAGVSMGGLHAAMTASLSPVPVGVCAWVAPPSAAPVFSKGLLSQFCAWATLEKQLLDLPVAEATATIADAPPPILPPREPIKDVKAMMDSYLSFTDIRNFPSPIAPQRAVFVLARDDLYVPKDLAIESWHSCVHHKWPGAQVVVVPGGHVTCTMFGSVEFRNRILSVL